MKIVFLGPPGTGKGTQAKMIAEYLGIPHISTGEMFRQMADEHNPLGVKAKTEYWDKGNLVPDELTIELVKKRILYEDCRRGFILDGFPRTIPQAEALEGIVDIAIGLFSSSETIIRRLGARRICKSCKKVYGLDELPKSDEKCYCGSKLDQRDDDKEGVIRERLRVYEVQTMPLIEFYSKKGLLRTVNGEGDKEQIYQEIIKVINSINS